MQQVDWEAATNTSSLPKLSTQIQHCAAEMKQKQSK